MWVTETAHCESAAPMAKSWRLFMQVVGALGGRGQRNPAPRYFTHNLQTSVPDFKVHFLRPWSLCRRTPLRRPLVRARSACMPPGYSAPPSKTLHIASPPHPRHKRQTLAAVMKLPDTPLQAHLLAQALGESAQRVLGGRIERAAAGGHAMAAHGADVDDVPVVASPLHVLRARPYIGVRSP